MARNQIVRRTNTQRTAILAAKLTSRAAKPNNEDRAGQNNLNAMMLGVGKQLDEVAPLAQVAWHHGKPGVDEFASAPLGDRVTPAIQFE